MDKIGDLLNRLTTANPNSIEICVPNSTYKRAILKVLFEEGWIAGITEKTRNSSLDVYKTVNKKNILLKDLIIYLKRPYVDASNFDWKGLNLKVLRISKPGRRIYYSAKETKKLVQKTTNIASTIVISTKKGVMTVQKAVDLNLGGELLFKISTLS